MAEDNLISQEKYDKMLEQYYMLYYELREKEDNHILRRLTVKQRQKLHKYSLRFCLLNKIEGITVTFCMIKARQRIDQYNRSIEEIKEIWQEAVDEGILRSIEMYGIL